MRGSSGRFLGANMQMVTVLTICQGPGQGIILTRGPHVMLGYWADGGMDLLPRPDLWLETGDIGKSQPMSCVRTMLPTPFVELMSDLV